MSEILTNLWITIDSFTYPEEIKINNRDIFMFNKAKRDFIIKPLSILLITALISRNRVQIYNKLKNYLLRGRTFQTVPKKDIEKLKSTTQKLNNYENIFQDSITVTGSRKLSSRKERLNKVEDEEMKVPLKPPTFSEEYGGFMRKHKEKVHRLSFLKKYFKRGNREDITNKAEHFLLNTKLIYLPFVLILLIYGYDLGLTYLALYLKYQPVVDQYYKYNNEKDKLI
jgi:hypothetical protein